MFLYVSQSNANVMTKDKKYKGTQLFWLPSFVLALGNGFISFLKQEDKLQMGTVIAGYAAENGVILEDDEWRKEF